VAVALTASALTSIVHVPAAGFCTNTFSTVSTVFAVPPDVDQLPAVNPLLPNRSSRSAR
jgi:hypothetical protein